MRNRLHVILGVLFVLALLFDVYLWGGLSKTPSMGGIVSDASAREVSLAGIYVPIGQQLLDLTGLGRSASEFAQQAFAKVEPRLLANPAAAMEILVSDMPTGVRFAYHGAPLLLLAFLVAFWRRPRVVRSMGTRR